MTQSRFDLSGKVAMITGGSRGIGLAVARAFVQAGAKVALVSRKQADLEAAAAEITAAGGEALAVAAHTGDGEAVATAVATTLSTFGSIDILVNNAATNPHFGPILTSEDSHWDKILDVNVKGYFRMAKACVPAMTERGGGAIINIASIAGLAPQPMMGVYCVSKAAVLMLTQVLAAELAGANIRVNAIAPGFVKTKFSAAIWSNEQIYDRVVAQIPQKRMADPDEIAGTAVYLASQAASFTTGAVLTVDGGQMVGSSTSFP